VRAARGGRPLGAVILALAACPPALAAATTVEAGGVRLEIDGAAWVQRQAGHPILIDLVCAGAECGIGSRLTVVADARPLPRPGSAAFTPGALVLGQVIARMQDVTPAGRIVASAPVAVDRLAARGGYRVVGDIETRALERIPAVAIVVPRRDGAVHLRLEGPLAGPALATRREALLATVEIR
jgi:hypothetical protein